MSDERDSLVGGDCDHDDLLELRSCERSARKADLRVCRQWRGCVSSSPKEPIFSTVLPPEKRNLPPSLQCCNFSAKSCLRSPSVHSVSLFLLGSRNDICVGRLSLGHLAVRVSPGPCCQQTRLVPALHSGGVNLHPCPGNPDLYLVGETGPEPS